MGFEVRETWASNFCALLTCYGASVKLLCSFDPKEGSNKLIQIKTAITKPSRCSIDSSLSSCPPLTFCGKLLRITVMIGGHYLIIQKKFQTQQFFKQYSNFKENPSSKSVVECFIINNVLKFYLERYTSLLLVCTKIWLHF